MSGSTSQNLEGITLSGTSDNVEYYKQQVQVEVAKGSNGSASQSMVGTESLSASNILH